MWEWLLAELQKAVKALPLRVEGVDKDDIVSNVALLLFENNELATDIYKHKKSVLLYKLLKREIYEVKSKRFFDNKMNMSRYQRIIDVCDEYGIEPIPENAYKIVALIDNNSGNFTISGVITLLSEDIPLKHGYYFRELTNINEL